MTKKISHKGHEIITETEFLIGLIKSLVLFPVLLAMYLAGRTDKEELFKIYHDFGHFFKDAQATYYLILINITVFIAEVLVLAPLGIIDFFILTPESLRSFNILTILTTTFLHASFLHLFGNMLYLFIFGRVVEKYLGARQFLMIYFGAAIIAHVISAGVFLQGGVGASGAISGLVAAAILIRPFYLSYILILPLPMFVIGFLQISGDFAGFFYPDPLKNVGHITHLIGYASISITAFFLNRNKRHEMTKGLLINILFLAVFITLNLIFNQSFL